MTSKIFMRFFQHSSFFQIFFFVIFLKRFHQTAVFVIFCVFENFTKEQTQFLKMKRNFSWRLSSMSKINKRKNRNKSRTENQKNVQKRKWNKNSKIWYVDAKISSFFFYWIEKLDRIYEIKKKPRINRIVWRLQIRWLTKWRVWKTFWHFHACSRTLLLCEQWRLHWKFKSVVKNKKQCVCLSNCFLEIFYVISVKKNFFSWFFVCDKKRRLFVKKNMWWNEN